MRGRMIMTPVDLKSLFTMMASNFLRPWSERCFFTLSLSAYETFFVCQKRGYFSQEWLKLGATVQTWNFCLSRKIIFSYIPFFFARSHFSSLLAPYTWPKMKHLFLQPPSVRSSVLGGRLKRSSLDSFLFCLASLASSLAHSAQLSWQTHRPTDRAHMTFLIICHFGLLSIKSLAGEKCNVRLECELSTKKKTPSPFLLGQNGLF